MYKAKKPSQTQTQNVVTDVTTPTIVSPQLPPPRRARFTITLPIASGLPAQDVTFPEDATLDFSSLGGVRSMGCESNGDQAKSKAIPSRLSPPKICSSELGRAVFVYGGIDGLDSGVMYRIADVVTLYEINSIDLSGDDCDSRKASSSDLASVLGDMTAEMSEWDREEFDYFAVRPYKVAPLIQARFVRGEDGNWVQTGEAKVEFKSLSSEAIDDFVDEESHVIDYAWPMCQMQVAAHEEFRRRMK